METCHGGGGDETWAKDFHTAVETVVYDEVVCHSHTVGFHRVALAIMVVSNFGVIKVGDAAVFSHFLGFA